MIFPKTHNLAEPFSLVHAEFFGFFFSEMGLKISGILSLSFFLFKTNVVKSSVAVLLRSA